jgi:TolB-like protein/class 3 adenylate cyclase/Tfp pilus assembly protein PilF
MEPNGFKRKLTAILSADVVGYSRLMGENEEVTIRSIKTNRKLIASLTEKHNGRVVDSPGDNLLAEFNSVIDAVRCAVEVQEEISERNVETLESQKMEYRIGINIGDVVEEEGRIYGDGVNITARLESLAEPGGICISGLVYSHIKNKLKLEYEYLGKQTVKNISEPVPLYRILSLSKAPLRSNIEEEQPNSLSNKPSIAVLPFVNMSNDPEQEYFSDGMTEELIGALTKVEGLKVISRTSAFCFKGKDVNLQTIGNKLKVNNILEGSVRKAGNRLRITVQLIDVTNDSHIWSETFDRELEDVFAIQEDISQAIVNKFKVQVRDRDKKVLSRSSIPNQHSHDLYLRGLFVWNRGDSQKAIDYLDESIVVDPKNAHSYSLLSILYTYRCLSSPYPAKESYEKAKATALKALEIDNMLADAHLAIGVVKMSYEYDWKGANEYLTRSIEINPGLWSTHYFYSFYKSALGQFDEAINSLKHAYELDPLSTRINSMIGMVLMMKREYTNSIEYLNKAQELTPTDLQSLANLGIAYAKKGDHEKAILVLQEGATRYGQSPFFMSALGFAYGVSGKKGKAQEIVDGFIDISKKRYFPAFFISRVYAGMGDIDKAIEWLEKAYENREPFVYLIKSVPSHDYMHSESRFIEILAKMGLAN